MYCPKCRAEFQKGVTYCHQCDMTLVEELPPPEAEKSAKDGDGFSKLTSGAENAPNLAAILATYNQGDLAIIKSVLESAKITYFIKGEFFNILDPMIQPAVVMVRNDQARLAMELLKDLDLTFNSVTFN